MKRLLIALLLLNAVYLIVHQFSDSDSDSEAAGAEKVSTTESGLVLPLATGAASQSRGSEAPTSEGARAATSDDDPEALVAAPLNAESPSTDATAAPVTPEVAAAQAKETATQPKAQKEAKSQKASGSAESTTCLVLGPFRREGEAVRALKLIDALIVEAELKDRDSKVLPDYWVYVGPESGIAAARGKAAAFVAEGTDSQVIGSGALKNSVSLGVFSRKPLADLLMGQLQEGGHEPKLRLLDQDRKGYQVNGIFRAGVRDFMTARDLPFIECAAP